MPQGLLIFPEVDKTDSSSSDSSADDDSSDSEEQTKPQPSSSSFKKVGGQQAHSRTKNAKDREETEKNSAKPLFPEKSLVSSGFSTEKNLEGNARPKRTGSAAFTTLTTNASSSSFLPHSVTSNPSTSNSSEVIKSRNQEKDDLRRKAEEILKLKGAMKPGFEKHLSIEPFQKSRKQLKKQRKLEREKTKGKDWFDLPATEITEEKKRDLEILQMRDILDPKSFYKSTDRPVLPKYFQLGTVVDQPINFYSSRIPRKQRKQTMVDELLADADFERYQKKKYSEIQETHTKARKGAFRKRSYLKKKKQKS